MTQKRLASLTLVVLILIQVTAFTTNFARADQTYTVFARVLDQWEKPIEGASVYLDGEFMGETNVEGEQNIYNVTEGTHIIFVTKKGYQNEEVTVSVTSNMSVTVTLKPAPKAGLPDLTIKEVSFEPSEPRAGEPVLVAVTIENVGEWAAKAFKWSWTSYPGAKPITGYVGAGLDAGVLATVYANFTYKEAGEYLTSAVADSENEVEEVDEENNMIGQMITVAKPAVPPTLPDLNVSEFLLGNYEPTEGEKVWMIALLRTSQFHFGLTGNSCSMKELISSQMSREWA